MTNNLTNIYSEISKIRLILGMVCTCNVKNLEMEPKYPTKSDVQLNPYILRTKNDKRVL